jgi:hypothetical protein
MKPTGTEGAEVCGFCECTVSEKTGLIAAMSAKGEIYIYPRLSVIFGNDTLSIEQIAAYECLASVPAQACKTLDQETRWEEFIGWNE